MMAGDPASAPQFPQGFLWGMAARAEAACDDGDKGESIRTGFARTQAR